MKKKDIPKSTWKPYHPATQGRLSTAEKNALPITAFAFPHARKESMIDASHVRNAMSRFDQVKGVTDSERNLAFSNIQKAAKHFDIQIKETDWHEFGVQHI